MNAEVNQRIREMTLEFVSQRSVVDTEDEIAMAEKIYQTLASLTYYKEHPEKLYYVDLKDDRLGRKVVVAELNGEKAPSNKTVILLGHFDTVGISDYGANKEFATNPEILAEKLKSLKLSDEVRADMASGDYLFARGIFDMKAGDAVNIGVLEEISRNVKDFEGNLLFVGVCDEEGNSAGMLNVVPVLAELKKNKGYVYRAMIDTDYMASAYHGDPLKYIYVGTVGKIMPTFYIVGKETHVGESFDGLDPNQIAAALTEEINLNPAYCDTVEGEVTLPPVTLKQRDLKTEYSCQTATKAVLMFNFATHASTPNQVMERMETAAQGCFEKVVAALNGCYEKYCAMVGREFRALPWRARTISYQEMLAAVREEVKDVDERVDAYIEELKRDEGMDIQTKSLKIVDFVHDLWSDKDPVIVVFFTPPYYPHIYVRDDDARGKCLIDAVDAAIAEVEEDPAFDYELMRKKFYPSISDLSYGAAPKDPAVVQSLEVNTPGYGQGKIYSLPMREMQELDLPVVDIGTVGKDAHKFTERLETRFTFTYTPELVYRTVLNLLK